jgi:ATP synthase protein I
MTTESKQTPTPGGAGPLLTAGAVALLALVALSVVAALTTGSTGLAGALTGGLMALLVFLTGSLVVNAVAGIAPGLSLVFALSTYTLQVLVLGLFFSALQGSDLMGSTLHAGWVGGSIIATTVVWLAVQVLLATRARIPAFDLPVEKATENAAQGATEPTHDLRHGAGERR